MNHVFVLLASLLLRLSSPLGTPHHSAPGALLETAAPALDSVAVAAAASHAAYLADVLHLGRGQALRLWGAAAVRQRELYAAETETAGTASATAAQAVETRYQHRLTQVLSASQYSALLALDDTTPALAHRRSLRQANRYWARSAFRPGAGPQPALVTTAVAPRPEFR
jgi:hypothetical protein